MEILGASFTPGRVRPGSRVQASLYFRVLKPLGKDYEVFVHLEDPEVANSRFTADHVPGEGRYPTSQWKAGETLKDDLSFVIPEDLSVRTLHIWVGFFDPENQQRLTVSNLDKARHDGQQRVLVARLPVDD